MKVIIIFLLSLWISAYTQAQLQGIRYRDDIFTGSDTMTEAYGSNVNYLQQNGYLLADYYFPRGDSFQNRAAIIFMHGGGFRAGHRNDAAIMDLCNKLAKKGYLTLSVDYRVGMPTDSDADLSAAIIRAVQDLNAAVRFTKVNAAKLGIDTNLIFISGASALFNM